MGKLRARLGAGHEPDRKSDIVAASLELGSVRRLLLPFVPA